jgi:hypothetical protein
MTETDWIWLTIIVSILTAGNLLRILIKRLLPKQRKDNR